MHRKCPFAVLVVLFLLCLPVVAGAQEQKPTRFVYATYFVCDVTKQDRADDIVKDVYAPVYDAQRHYTR